MIAVLTCSRRPVSYLAETLTGIDASATDPNRVVVVDGFDPPEVPAGWSVTLAPKPEWEWRTHNRYPFWECLEAAVRIDDDLIFFEDDVTLCKNAVRFAEQLAVPDDLALISLFAPFGDESMVRGIHVSPARDFTFCQGMKIPLRTCRTLVDRRADMVSSRLGGSDNCVALIGDSLGWKIGTLRPGIVQHVGDVSLVSERLRMDRVSRTWPGKEFDAMTLAEGE